MKNIIKLLSIIIVSNLFISCNRGSALPEIKLYPVTNGNEFQYIDQKGKVVINPQFNDATLFRDDLALVKSSRNNKIGFINEKGEYAIDPKYIRATTFNEGLAWVVAENMAPSAIDKKGRVKFTLVEAEEVKLFKGGLAAFSVINEDGIKEWGFVNKKGSIIINPQFSGTRYFSDGLCAVVNENNKIGFIDKKGNIVINYQFDNALEFRNGISIVAFDKKYGVINKDGKYIINPQFDFMYKDGDLYMVVVNDKWGWTDKNGKYIINPQFDEVYPFNGKNITPVRMGKDWGYIDKNGNIEINPQFEHAFPFNGKTALVSINKKFGLIDLKGKIVINPQFFGISDDIGYYYYGISEYSDINTDYFNSIAGLWREDCREFSSESYELKISKINGQWFIIGGIESSFGGTITNLEYDRYSEIYKITYINNNDMGGDWTTQTFEFYFSDGNLSFYKNQNYPEHLAEDLTIFRKCYYR